MSRTLGSSSVNVVPQFQDDVLRSKLDEISKKRVNINAKVGLDSKDADTQLGKFRAASDKAVKGIAGTLSIDSRSALNKLLEFRATADKAIKGIPSGKLSLDDSQALVKALKFRTEIDTELRKAGVVDVSVTGTDRALLKLARFQAESAAITDSSSGGEGAFSAISSALGSLGEYVIPALIAGLVVASPLIAGVASGLVAAGAGAGAFGLLAYPAIEKVIGALGDTKAQLDKLPEGERNAVESVKGLEGAWQRMSAAMSPQVFDLMDKGVSILAKLLPDVLPFAETFASVLGQIESKVGKFTVSPAFKDWLSQFQKLEGPSLNAIATGLGHVITSLGKLLTVMSSKDVVNSLNVAFSVLDGTIIGITATVKGMMITWDTLSSNFAAHTEDIYKNGVAPMVTWFTTSLPHAWSTSYQHFMTDFASPLHGAYSNVVSGTINDFVDPLVNFFTGTIPHAYSTAYTKFMANFVSPLHSAYSNVVSGTMNDLVHPLVTFFTEDIPNAAKAAVKGVSEAWSGLGGAMLAPVKFVVDHVYDDGIAKMWNDLAGHVGLPKLPTFSFAAGGTVPGASSNGGDNHLAMVKSGELIVPSQHAPKFSDMARRSGIPGFAAGGVIPGLGAIVNGAESVANDVTGGLFSKVLNSGVSAVANSLINPLLNAIPSGSSQLSQIPKDAATTLVHAAISTLTNAGGGSLTGSGNVAYNVSAGAKQWTSVVLKALALNGLPASLLNQVLTQITSESGGNPDAQNNWDSNAAGGDPSRGLLQTIGSTFAAYHIAGTSSNIFNPLANVAAAIAYAKKLYGPTLINAAGNGLGSGHGYSAGGVTPEGIIGMGLRSGTPYSIGSGEYVGPLMGNSVSAMSSGDPRVLVPILQQQNKMLAQLVKIGQATPQMYANGLNGAVGGGARKAYFASGG